MESRLQRHHEIKAHAVELYKKIGSEKNPALRGAEVAFTRIGFNHLIYKGRHPRPIEEQDRRFELLKYATSVIRNPNAEITYRCGERRMRVNRHGKKVFKNSIIHFWTFKEKIDGRNIKLVVSQVNEGRCNFSVLWKMITNKKILDE